MEDNSFLDMEEKHDDQLAGKNMGRPVWQRLYDRCTFSPEELDSLYKREYGISREEMNTRFYRDWGLRTREFWKLGAMLAIS